MRTMPLLLLPVFSGALRASEGFTFDTAHSGGAPVPAAAVVSLQLPENAVVGETVTGKFVVTNAGAESFTVSIGGDYRGSPVPRRLKVRITNADWQVLPELSEGYMDMGGIVQSPAVEPGKSKEIEFDLQGYAAVLEPGPYTVQASHDLGWKVDAARPHPVATATITFSLPDAAQAAARVRELLSGDARENSWSLVSLRHPVFLLPLTDEAKKGSAAAVSGISGIAAAEANQALLELLAADKNEVVEAAARALAMRVPSLSDPTQPAFPGIFDRSNRGAYFQHWQPAMDVPLLAGARRLLEHADEALMGAGADLIAARGGADEAPLVLESLQRALEIYRQPRSGPGANVLDPPGAQRQLIGALDALRARGWRVDFLGGGTAKLIAQFRQFGDNSIPHASDDAYIERSFTWVENGPAVLKENALRALPMTADYAVKPLRSALDDQDWGVVRAACEAAGRSERKEFIPQLCQVVESIHETFVQAAAHEAAVALGAKLPLWEAWTEVVTDQSCMVRALQHLCIGTLEIPGDGSMGGNSHSTREERFAIRDAWRAFLMKHRERLDEGKRVPLNDPFITPALTGSGFASRPAGHAVTFSLSDGTQWPKAE
ncbi:MAG: HEAT repeat domain-containing protein [Verrucomicrobiales bacterium]